MTRLRFWIGYTVVVVAIVVVLRWAVWPDQPTWVFSGIAVLFVLAAPSFGRMVGTRDVFGRRAPGARE